MRAISRRGAIAAGAAAIVPAPAWAETPLVFTQHPLAFMRIEVGGRPAMALLDSGGVRGVQISGNLADVLHLELNDTGQTTQRYQDSGASIRAGVIDVTIDGRSWGSEQVSVAAGDIERIAEQIGRTFDAILGWGFLSREGFAMDFAQSRFVIGPGAGERAIAFDDAHGVPVSAGQIDGVDVDVLIDTGAPSCILDASLAGGVAERARKTLALGDRTIETDFRVRDLSALSRGTGAKAVLGLNAMRSGCLALDARARRLTLD